MEGVNSSEKVWGNFENVYFIALHTEGWSYKRLVKTAQRGLHNLYSWQNIIRATKFKEDKMAM
jgi:hypothetical protein